VDCLINISYARRPCLIHEEPSVVCTKFGPRPPDKEVILSSKRRGRHAQTPLKSLQCLAQRPHLPSTSPANAPSKMSVNLTPSNSLGFNSASVHVLFPLTGPTPEARTVHRSSQAVIDDFQPQFSTSRIQSEDNSPKGAHSCLELSIAAILTNVCR
jgi:hypothetical protein